jgi:hypothetical protein
MIRATRSLKVRSDCVESVKNSVRRNGFPNQKELAYHCQRALSTVSNFLNGKPIDYLNFVELCETLNLNWQSIADFRISDQLMPESIQALIRCFDDSPPQLAVQLQAALQNICHHTTLQVNALSQQKLPEILKKYDYILLLLSASAATSELTTEEVRQIREFYHLHAKPVPLVIRTGFSLESRLNHDLRGYLAELPQWEWQSELHTSALIQEIQTLLKTGEITIPLEPSTVTSALLDINPTTLPLPIAEPELPEGQVDIASALYVERPPIEDLCYAAIAKPGALLRIKAARQMGKTSLMSRILHRATQLGYLTVPLSFQLADGIIFSDLNQFLQWFCSAVSWKLDLAAPIETYWNPMLGSKMSCTGYFEKYLLPEISCPLVLGLDEVDLVFQYPDIASDFLAMLRAWHESAKNRDLWKKVRLVVVHSTEVYVPLNIHQSPFNVGLAIELPEFQSAQLQDLARRHGLMWDETQVAQLQSMVGGHPFLTRVALYQIAQHQMHLEQVLQTAPTEAGVYRDHLRRHLWNLERHPDLATAMHQVVSAGHPIRLEAVQAFQLHSLGLVNLQGNEVTPRCQLYQQYFLDRLSCK